ncbi:MAG: helix-hairpin-helix domain-containing protein [Endomicrobiia bacterium]|nr:helix-hairpin-helix domain-containing protein [Endomicrobiia bacterium]
MTKPRILSAIFFILMFCVAPRPLALRAAFEDKIPAARPAAMGGGFVSVANDANGIFYNPASLGGLAGADISLTQTSLFNLPDAPYMTLAAAFPTKTLGSLGFAYTQFGGSIYKETELTLSHSFPLARKVYAGYNIRNQAVDMKTFGGAAGMGLDVGFYAGMSNNVSAGFSAGNITGPMLGSTEEPLPQVYRMGASYHPAAGVILLLETSKDLLATDLSYHGGAEINVSKNFVFRAGTRSNPSGFSAGFGFNAGIFKIAYALITHPMLETQNFFTLGMKFGAEEQDVAPVAPPRRRGATRRAPSTRASASRIAQYEEVKNLKVNPNTATPEDLKEIPGVGALTAQRIIDHRNQGVTFTTADDLMGVPRMTKRILERMRPYLVFDGSAQSKPPAPTPQSKPLSRPAPQVSDDDGPPEPEPDEDAPPPVPVKAAPVKAAPAVVPPPAKAVPVETPKVAAPVIAPALPTAPAVPVPSKPVESPNPVAPAKTPEPMKPSSPVAPAAPEKSAATLSDDMLDINTAGAQELQVIGFTSTQAKNIIRYRAKEGNFSSVDDILKVPGVDARTLGNVRESITAR